MNGFLVAFTIICGKYGCYECGNLGIIIPSKYRLFSSKFAKGANLNVVLIIVLHNTNLVTHLLIYLLTYSMVRSPS